MRTVKSRMFTPHKRETSPNVGAIKIENEVIRITQQRESDDHRDDENSGQSELLHVHRSVERTTDRSARVAWCESRMRTALYCYFAAAAPDEEEAAEETAVLRFFGRLEYALEINTAASTGVMGPCRIGGGSS